MTCTISAAMMMSDKNERPNKVSPVRERLTGGSPIVARNGAAA